MHLAAFVEDVFGADRRLTVRTEPPPGPTRTEVAGALPGTAVRVETGKDQTPAHLVRVGDDAVALAVTPAATNALVLNGGLTAVDTVQAHRVTQIAGIGESTVLLADPPSAVLRAAAEGVASVAASEAESPLYATTTVLDTLDGSETPTAVHVYGPETPGAISSELEGVHLALASGTRDGGAAVLAVPHRGGYQGFLTFRSAIISDLEAYLLRTYGRGEQRAPIPSGT